MIHDPTYVCDLSGNQLWGLITNMTVKSNYLLLN